MKSNVLSCSYWTWVLHSIPLIMICYCQGCGNTSAYVILPSIGLDHICPNDNSLYWLMVWNLKRFLCRVEYHKDRFWVLFFLQFTSCLLVTSSENMVSNSTCMLMTVSCILHLACQQMSSIQHADGHWWYSCMVCSKYAKTEWWQNRNAGNWFKIPYYPETSWFECGIHRYYTWWAC